MLDASLTWQFLWDPAGIKDRNIFVGFVFKPKATGISNSRDVCCGRILLVKVSTECTDKAGVTMGRYQIEMFRLWYSAIFYDVLLPNEMLKKHSYLGRPRPGMSLGPKVPQEGKPEVWSDVRALERGS